MTSLGATSSACPRNPQGLVEAIGLGEKNRQVVVGIDVARPQLDRLPVGVLRLRHLILLAQDRGEVVVGLGIVLPNQQRLLVFVESLFPVAQHAERIAEVVVRLGVIGIDRDRPPVEVRRLLELASVELHDPQVVEGLGRLRVELDRPTEGNRRFAQLAALALGFAEISVILRIVLVVPNRTLERFGRRSGVAAGDLDGAEKIVRRRHPRTRRDELGADVFRRTQPTSAVVLQCLVQRMIGRHRHRIARCGVPALRLRRPAAPRLRRPGAPRSGRRRHGTAPRRLHLLAPRRRRPWPPGRHGRWTLRRPPPQQPRRDTMVAGRLGITATELLRVGHPYTLSMNYPGGANRQHQPGPPVRSFNWPLVARRRTC